VNPAWIDALYLPATPVSSIPFLSPSPVNANTHQSNPSSASIDDIARVLKSNWTFDQIATRLHTSPKRISEMSKVLKRGEEPSQSRPRGRPAKLTSEAIGLRFESKLILVSETLNAKKYQEILTDEWVRDRRNDWKS
jgi:hypothetical protein